MFLVIKTQVEKISPKKKLLFPLFSIVSTFVRLWPFMGFIARKTWSTPRDDISLILRPSPGGDGKQLI